jgi:hypothetical protein
MHTVEVHLDGAFAVVIQKNKNNSILAFSPRDPSEPHKFYFYSPIRELDATKNYHFTLSEDGLEQSKKPEIRPGFEDFFAETEHWRLTDNLVMIELPAPESITFSGHREFVTFASGRTGWMPTNHILKYRAKDASRAKLLCSQMAEGCPASPDSPPGTARFFFEVGPPQGSDPMHTHAVNFFNYMLERCFSDLKDKYELKSIGYPGGGNKTASIYPEIVPAVLRTDNSQGWTREVSYTLDCKLGGLTTTTSSPPTGP